MTEHLSSDHSIVTIGDVEVSIRPITKEDKDIEAAFVHKLSFETKRERFFEGMRDLSPYMLNKLCDIDYINTMAYVATIQDGGKETEVGVCRYASGLSDDEREMAIVIADDVSYSSVATALLKKLVAHAKNNNVKHLFSIDLKNNDRMRSLAKAFGMHEKQDPMDSNQVVYRLTIEGL